MGVSGPWLASWEHHVRRLRELEVTARELYPELAAAFMRRFVAEFVQPERASEVLDGQRGRALDLERYLRNDCTIGATARGSLAWLRGGHVDLPCVRIDRRLGLPALEIDTTTMEDTWAGSWPGAYVNFERARALVISADYEAFRCDLRRSGSPYR